MDKSTTYFPNYTIGKDAYSEIPSVCEKYGKKAVLIGGVKALAAAKNKVLAALENSSIELTGVFEYGGEASRENMEALMGIKEVADADMLFVCGGGKAIDTCKVIAQETGRPFFTLPTIASTCAACTSLGIVYHPDGTLREYSFQTRPAEWVFIDTQIIAEAPEIYLWAGMGDSLAKFYECSTSARGDELRHSASMGIQIAHLCVTPFVRYGVAAMEECRNNKAGEAIREVILGIIVSTGFASNLVGSDLNTGLAHACYNGFTLIDSVEHNGHLHGEIVAYCVLILLIVDGQKDEYEKIFAFSRDMGLPTRLSQIDASLEDADTVIAKALSGVDVEKWPYEVKPEMIFEAMKFIEEDNDNKGF